MKKRFVSLLLILSLGLSLAPKLLTEYAAADNSEEKPATNSAVVTIPNLNAAPGETFSLELTIQGNPGILGAALTLSYDSDLTLTDSQSGPAFQALTMTRPGSYESPCNFVWDGQSLTPEGILDGTFLTLTFQVSENAVPGKLLPVELSCKPGGIVDDKLKPVTVQFENGGITALEYLPGDLNGDSSIDTKDLILLRRHLAGGYSVNINTIAADVNGDLSVNTTDVILLRRYLAGGYGVVLKPPPSVCAHAGLTANAYAAPSCTEDGHIAYWHCSDCGKYFSDELATAEISTSATVIPATGHTSVIDPAVPATTTSKGLTEGSHCSVCGEILIPQRETEILKNHAHNITYDIANGDPYLMEQIQKGAVTNPNPDSFSEEASLPLKSISVPGYRFLGWYDLPSGNNAVNVKTISAGTNNDVDLFAHWEKISYTVYFKSSLFVEENQKSYTVDTGTVLPTPKLSNYVFTGWSDEQGHLYKSTTIPAGTTGNITLTANWTSERNKTWSKTTLDDPVIYEDLEHNVLLFAYEIGEIQNVPLRVIKDFGYINENGVAKHETTTKSYTTDVKLMESYVQTVANATTESSNWSLSNQWNESTHIDKTWCEENGYTEEEAVTRSKTDTDTWNISNGTNGSVETTVVDSNQNDRHSEAKIGATTTDSKKTSDFVKQSDSNTAEVKTGVDVGFSVTTSLENSATVGAEFGAEGIGKVSGSNTLTTGVSSTVSADVSLEAGSSETHGSETGHQNDTEHQQAVEQEYVEGSGNTHISSNSATTSYGWNSTSSYGGSSSVCNSATTAFALSKKITDTYGYGKDYSRAYTNTESQGLSATRSSSDEYGASVTYSATEITSQSLTCETTTAKTGYHRWVVAGTAHVFAVVGYDMTTDSFFTYTFSVMDDETHDFEDYSYTSANFNDNENGVLPFEVPYYVCEYVGNRVNRSGGLKIDKETGTVTEYTGPYSYVVIPEYWNLGDGDVVKVTGISPNAFQGNTNLKAVILSDFIEEIPDNAFAGCTSLIGIGASGIKRIGKNAFAGCTSFVESALPAGITQLGDNAFLGVQKLTITPGSAAVALSAAGSGAVDTTLLLNEIEAGALTGVEMKVLPNTKSFTLNGYGKRFEDFSLVSDAKRTDIIKANFTGHGKIPLLLSSDEVTMDQVDSNASGIALVLSGANTRFGVQGTVSMSSDSANTVLSRSFSLYETLPSVVGRLAVRGKLLVAGQVEHEELMTYDSYEHISAETFDRMLHSFTIYFDPNGGICNVASREVPNSTPLGELPIPNRQYYTFVGWFLEDGTQVTSSTVFSAGVDQTVIARWSQNTFTLSFDPNGGSCDTPSKVIASGENVGTLPKPSRAHFNFTGWFLSDGTQVNEDTVFPTEINQTVFAHWSPVPYSVSWSGGTGYSISVNRIASPYGKAASGNLSSGDTVYYGDELNVSYNASTGYSIHKNGQTSVTVAGNVGSEIIYASASANNYTYYVEHKSTNGTVLETSTYTNVYGSSANISPKDFAGYSKPGSQYVIWDSTSPKTITFTYSPNSVGTQSVRDNAWWWCNSSTSGIRFSVSVSFSNRTADGVDATIVWTNTITKNTWYGYWQAFNMSVGNGNTGTIRLTENSTWSSNSGSPRSVSKTVTVRVTGLQPTTTAVSYSATASSYSGSTNPGSFSGTLTIPTY